MRASERAGARAGERASGPARAGERACEGSDLIGNPGEGQRGNNNKTRGGWPAADAGQNNVVYQRLLYFLPKHGFSLMNIAINIQGQEE